MIVYAGVRDPYVFLKIKNYVSDQVRARTRIHASSWTMSRKDSCCEYEYE